MPSYKSPNDIAMVIFCEMTADHKHVVRDDAKTAEDMVRYHHGIGTHIRNRFALWDPQNPHTKVDAKPNAAGVIDDPLHPDQVSHAILMKVWEMVTAEVVTEATA